MKYGYIRIKGKGGKIREVPITDSIRIEFEKFLRLIPAGHKLFVPDGKQTHIAKTELQNFITTHRKHIRTQSPSEKAPLTFHGLRHTYAAEQYTRLIREGYSEYDARKRVSELLGHERDDVTRVYLAGVKKTDDTPEPGEEGGGEDV
jgi:integrase